MPLTKKRLFQKLVVNSFTWHIFKPLIFIADRLKASRSNYLARFEEDDCTEMCETIFAEKTVLHGLFKGMKMDGIKATGSNNYAKLLGVYETGVMGKLEELLQKNYNSFIDIGADEGSYAVGIARLYPQMDIYLFDCNSKARKQSKMLAALNKIKNRFEVNECFHEQKIEHLRHQKKLLFLVDCEGCENKIFSDAFLHNFKFADFIIELHYEKHPMILEKLTAMFTTNHSVNLITAKSDFEIIRDNRSPELKGLSFEQKKFILAERDYFTQWLVATSNEE